MTDVAARWSVLWRRLDPASRYMWLQRRMFYAEAWTEAAGDVGATVRRLGGGGLAISRRGTEILVRTNRTPLDSPAALALAGDKPRVYGLLRAEGIPMPRHRRLAVGDRREALAFLESIGGPVVVKPARNSSAGQGVSTGIATPDGLVRALAAAGACCPEVLVEEQVQGDNLRLLLLDGELIDAVVRHPPALLGDGRSTIRELVRTENRRRLIEGRARAQVLIGIDGDMRNTLECQGLTLDSRPAAGRQVVLKRVVNDNRGNENESAGDLVTSEMVEAACRMAAVVGARWAGIDLIRHRRGFVALEVNTTPGHYYHYHRRGQPVRVAVPVLRRALGMG